MEENENIDIKFRCSQCNRVSAGIEKDGICGSPTCRKHINMKVKE